MMEGASIKEIALNIEERYHFQRRAPPNKYRGGARVKKSPYMEAPL